MKKKNPRDNKGKKIPQPANTFVPQNLLSLIREEKLISCPEEKSSKIKPYIKEIEPFEIPPLWVEKSIDEINSELLSPQENINNNSENIEKYNDPMHEELINNLPLSLIKMTKNNILWLRPENYIINDNIDREIRRLYPKKKYIQMREDIKELYKEEKEDLNNISEDENMDDLMNDDTIALKKTIFKDFYKFLEKKPKILVVNYSERDETDEEFQKRVEETIEKQKDNLLKSKLSRNKNEKKIIVQQPNEFKKEKIKIKDPGNIDVRLVIDKNIKYNKSLISWISSIYQIILDLKIKDCNTYNSIFENIYPQKNGIPIYNPNGHYIIKMYFMGNARKIDIDDRIPCNKNGEYILPRCENLSQIWPAILTKALLKLNIYKAKHPFYINFEENIDISYIYALTGFHTRLLNFESVVNNYKFKIPRSLKSQKINIEKIKSYQEIENNQNKSFHSKNNADLKDIHEIQNILYINLNNDNYLNHKKYVLCINKKKENIKDNIIKDNEFLSYEEIIEEYKKHRNSIEQKDNSIDLQEKEKSEKLEKIEENVNQPILTEKNKNKKKNHEKRMSCIKLPQSIVKLYKASQMSKRSKNEDSNINENNEKKSNEKNNEIKENRRSHPKQKTITLRSRNYLNKEIEIIDNYAYSIIDFFSSNNFNMNRLKPLNFEDIKKKLKSTNVVFKQLPKEEKREYIKQRKILKSEQILIKNKRIEALKTEGKPFLIIKLINNCFGQSKFQYDLKFDEKEILMAKKCILNNWKYPPPDFFNYYFKKYEDEDSEQQDILIENIDKNEIKSPKKIIKKNKKKKISTFDWTRENYIQLN